MALELTLAQAKSKPANFMYLWASDEFLMAIPRKHALIIKQKQLNERLLLARSAEKFNTTKEAYENAIRAEFIKQFGITPAQALDRLAKGEKVCGKDWAAGIYGVGAISTRKFKDGYSVGETSGYIIDPNGDICPADDIIYGEDGTASQIVYYDNTSGMTYVSEKNKKGKWYAKSYSDANGNMFKPNGSAMSGADAGSVWETVDLSFDWIQKIINWILSLFNISTETQEQLTPDNTLPNQKTDGFVYESGISEAGMIALALLAGGTILATSKKKSK